MHPFVPPQSAPRRARKEADRLACEAWYKRMLGFKGPAQPSPTLGDVLNAGYLYLEVRCLGCDTHQTVALDVVRRPKTTPIHELERYMRCKDCSQTRGYGFKRSYLVACRSGRFRPAIRLQRGGRQGDERICGDISTRVSRVDRWARTQIASDIDMLP
jgi:hypothetical protein